MMIPMSVAIVTEATCVGLFLGSPYFKALCIRKKPEKPQSLGHPVYRWVAVLSILAFCVLGSYVLAAAFTALTMIPIPWFLASMGLAVVFRRTTEMTADEFPDQEAALISAVVLVAMLLMYLGILA